MPPLLCIIIADCVRATENRIGEIGVNMIECFMLPARRANPAWFSIHAVFTMNVLGKSPCQCKLTDARRTFKQQRMRQTAGIGHSPQTVLYGLMCRNIGKFHNLLC